MAQLINERLAQVECVLDEADVGGFAGAVAHHDLDDVEAEVDARVVEKSKIVESDAAHVALLLAVHSLAGSAKLHALARLDFDDHQPVLVPAHEVDFTRAGLESFHENLVAVTAQIAGREFLPTFTERHLGGGIDRELAQPVPSHATTSRSRTKPGEVPLDRLERPAPRLKSFAVNRAR